MPKNDRDKVLEALRAEFADMPEEMKAIDSQAIREAQVAKTEDFLETRGRLKLQSLAMSTDESFRVGP